MFCVMAEVRRDWKRIVFAVEIYLACGCVHGICSDCAFPMKIVVAVRCYNEAHNVERFLKGYSFADEIVISDGGSTDGTLEMLEGRDKVTLLHFNEYIEVGGFRWNPDAPHMNFVMDYAKSLDPDWLIFDDFDCVPNYLLRGSARTILEETEEVQVNAFRLYMWGDDQYFPEMNQHFNLDYTSLWAWQPRKIDIHADPSQKHGTIVGATPNNRKLWEFQCLLHKSWNPATVNDKINKYNAVGLAMSHPLQFAGVPQPLPIWAKE